MLGGEDFFVGVNGELPTELFSLPNIKFIIFDGSEDRTDTRRISGKIPAAIGNAKGLKRLDLDRNNLTGEIPDELYDITTLELVDLDNNLLTGTISPKFANLKNLFFLTIGNNEFKGQAFPTEIAGLDNLGKSKNDVSLLTLHY